MSCALASPTDGVCANRRPIRGRKVQQQVGAVDQPRLTPLASGHGSGVVEQPRPVRAPFAADAPEATFSLAQLRPSAGQDPSVVAVSDDVGAVPADARVERVAPPSFREIRAGRAAAAARAPEAVVSIPLEEVESGTLVADAERHGSLPVAPASTSPSTTAALPGMEQLVERVRRRTAERLARSGSSFSPA